MAQVVFFVDGFNIYHALDDENKYQKYKWLNYWDLAQCYITRKDAIVKVLYFTAFTWWNQQKMNRHKRYVNALKSVGVEVVEGAFKEREKKCRICQRKYKIPEEKMTDVNIAVRLLQEGRRKKIDTCILVSGDNDLAPVVEAFGRMYSKKRIEIVLPIGPRGRYTKSLRKHAHHIHRMTEKHLASSQFDPIVTLPDGNQLRRPPSWK